MAAMALDSTRLACYGSIRNRIASLRTSPSYPNELLAPSTPSVSRNRIPCNECSSRDFYDFISIGTEWLVDTSRIELKEAILLGIERCLSDEVVTSTRGSSGREG